jgi:ketosteroid isomerase-like protein
MTLPAADRDILFKNFARAFFKRDIDALYETVTEDFTWASLGPEGDTETITGREAVTAKLNQRSTRLENVRFEDVIYHHAPDATFMTFRLTATRADTGAPHAEVGVERYTFKNGRIAVKDVYRKPS